MGQLVAGAVWGGRLASLDPLALIWQASWVVQLVLLLLAGFSILSWAVIVFKWRELRAADEDDEAFLEVYHEGSYEEAYKAAHDCEQGPIAAIFLAAHAERLRIAKYAGKRADAPLDDPQLERVARRIHWTASRGGAPARARPRLPRDDGQLDAVHRPVRHGDRHHQRLRGASGRRAARASRSSRRASPRR